MRTLTEIALIAIVTKLIVYILIISICVNFFIVYCREISTEKMQFDQNAQLKVAGWNLDSLT